MVKCTKGQVRLLKKALYWKGDPKRRERIRMVLLRESGMTQPAIAQAMGVSLSTVNRAHMSYDGGGLKGLQSKRCGGRQRENMTLAEEKALLAGFAQGRRSGRDVGHPRYQGGLREGHRPRNQQQHGLQSSGSA